MKFSNETANKVVRGFYRGYLRREPDDEGLQYWSNSIIESGDLSSTLLLFLESDEFKSKHDQELRGNSELLNQIVSKFNRDISIIDIGAILIGDEAPLWNRLLNHANLRVIGFDPQIDSSSISRNHGHHTVSITNYGFALGDGEEHTLHVNNQINTSSFYSLSDNKDVFHLSELKTEKQVFCPTQRLDEINLPTTIDLLKIDVQGYELEILRFGSEALARTNLAFIEVAFNSIYKDQPLFSEIDMLMRSKGFRLIDLNNVNYPMLGVQNNQADLLMWGDALYQRIPRDPESIAAQNLILGVIFEKWNLAEYGNLES